MTAVTHQGSQLHYFSHDVMRFFAHHVLQRGYEALQPASRHGRAFRFDPATRTIWRRGDPLTPLALRDFATPLAEARHLAAWWARRTRSASPAPALFSIPGLPACGMVVHARDATLVVVQRRPRRVWKLVRDASCEVLLERERQAAHLAPTLAPQVVEWQPPGEEVPGYVALEYALDTEPVTRDDLPSALRSITPALVDTYQRAGIEAATVDDVDARLRRTAARVAQLDPSPFSRAAAETVGALRALLAEHARRRPVLFRTFVHGDIQASNLRRHGRKIALIDWGNAGTHNLLFDPFVVELFSPTPSVWVDVLVKGAVADPSRGFQGWLPACLDALSAAGVTLGPADIAAGLVCCAAEKTAAIVARHGGTDEVRGLLSLGRIQRLLSAAAGGPAAPFTETAPKGAT